MTLARRPQCLEPREILAGVVGRARERARRHKRESLGISDRCQRLELIRWHKTDYRVMFARRLQVLPDGEEIHIGGAQIVHHLQYFVSLLAEPNHDSRFGENAWIELFGALQELDRGEVARAGAHREVL